MYFVHLQVGVQDVKLTLEGQNLFKQESLVSIPDLFTNRITSYAWFPLFRSETNRVLLLQRIQKYHVRYVETMAPGTLPLAELNEISISSSGRILTFQGHPELTSEISYILSGRDDGTYAPSKSVDKNRKDIVIEEAGTPHDGQLIWRHIMKWALP